jgi:hypothetical protein
MEVTKLVNLAAAGGFTVTRESARKAIIEADKTPIEELLQWAAETMAQFKRERIERENLREIVSKI